MDGRARQYVGHGTADRRAVGCNVLGRVDMVGPYSVLEWWSDGCSRGCRY